MGFNLVASYNRFVNALSFTGDFQRLRRLVNLRIDSPETIEEFPPSHPQGFVKEFKRRRISIVESYVSILHYLESDQHRERIRALRLLEEQTLHSKNLAMPLNTARVQLALMKEVVKNRDNKRRQLELLQDFSICSYGQPSVIRRYLDELNILELPEEGQRLVDMDMGWDNHVHDNSSYGRKTPSQLIIDAFIKGISRITVAFNLLSNRGNLEEMVEAGEILGVGVELAVEFSVKGPEGRFHFMFLLPELRDRKELVSYLKHNRKPLGSFIEGLEKNQRNRVRAIGAILQNFNKIFLPGLNEGYARGSVYHLPKLRLDAIDEIVPMENLNRMHLGEFLYLKYKPVLLRRVILAKTRLANAEAQHRAGEISRWDFDNLRARYEELRRSYVELNPETLRERYFSDLQLLEYATVFDDLATVVPPLRKSGGLIKIIHPLEHGIDAAYQMILENWRWIDRVELYNMYDSINRPVDDILRFTSFVNILNSGDADAVKPYLVGHDIGFNDKKLKELVTGLAERKLVPVAGSDATGRSTNIPGMGFIHRSRITGKYARRYLDRHFGLPELVCRVIEGRGRYVEEMSPAKVDPIVSMGKAAKFVPNKVGDEQDIQAIPLTRAVRYLNPRVKNFVAIAVGFVVSYFVIGLTYAIVWFLITGTRHVIVDLLSRRGPRVREWTLRSVNFRNMSNSLFFTGLSVPILGFVKMKFDLLWPFAAGTVLFNLAKFFFIAFANGLYLVGHNRLRGFPRSVIRGNFFRSIISWPFASLAAPLGDLLMVPTIVQAKFWSDFAGGFIEGSGKFARAVGLTRRDLSEVITTFCTSLEERRYTAALDLLHYFERQPRSRNSLREILFGRENLLARIGGFFRRDHTAPSPRRADYEELVAWFAHSSNYQKLADFVIENYGDDYAVVLTGLVSRQYNALRDWLLAGRRYWKKTDAPRISPRSGVERESEKEPVGSAKAD